MLPLYFVLKATPILRRKENNHETISGVGWWLGSAAYKPGNWQCDFSSR